jgi:MFS family permease
MWAASLASNLADGLLRTAAPLLAVTLTKDPVLISLMSALVMLPWLIFAIPIGGIVDRFDRRFLLAGSNAIRFVIAALLSLSISSHIITISWLFFASFLIGVCEVVSDTTSQSLIPQILDKSNYEKGNSRLQISETVVQNFVGAPVSGFLYAAAIYLPFAFNSAGFAVATILALSIPIQFLQDIRRDQQSALESDFLTDVRFGMRFLYEHKPLWRLVITTTSIGFFASLASATTVLFILDELHAEPAYFGLILSVGGVGAILGGIAAPHTSKKFGRGRALATNIFIGAFSSILIGVAPNIYWYMAISASVGFAISQWNVLLMSLYQSLIPSNLYGRIHGTRRTLVWGLMPVGSFIGGYVAKLGLRIPFIFGGIVATIIAMSALKFLVEIGDNSAKERAENL